MRAFAPHAGRGLKHNVNRVSLSVVRFRPARGAWIETVGASVLQSITWTFRPARGAWIETSESFRV